MGAAGVWTAGALSGVGGMVLVSPVDAWPAVV